MHKEVDLVITFRATKKTSLFKHQIRDDAHKAEQQYSRLIEILTRTGLRAVGRRGESLGHLLIFVSCPEKHLRNLVKRERQSDFLSGLPTTPVADGAEVMPLSPADRLRLVHAFVTSMPADGGLGITPDSPEWDLVESVFPLHDREFNESWIHSWTPRRIASASVQLEKIREQFGDSVALYFAFLSSYTHALIFPAFLGVFFYFFGTKYSPVYSILILVWSVIFVEWWRVRERILSIRFGTRGSFRVEKRRAEYTPGFQWWKREFRVVASLPIILLFAGILVGLLTAIFVLEAFVTHLYTGPGHEYLGFSPTILFIALVPRLLGLYQTLAQKLTAWENHAHHSSYDASLTLKTFALSALVAYMGLALSAFVYVPFGETVMQIVQFWLFQETTNGRLKAFNTTRTDGDGVTDEKVVGPIGTLWDVDTSHARHKLNPGRLRDQMFAYTVTNQVINTFTEVGMPFIVRALASFRNRKKTVPTPGSPGKNGVKKRVVFEDEKEKGGMEEREFLDGVRCEAALPEYRLFEDYSEMVTQFGYVALWSAIWPLAPAMALLNNFLELRSDAFKMTVHYRRPIPTRTDTIGPWLETLTFLTWLAALTNSALVYLFHPRLSAIPSQLNKVHQHLFSASGAQPPDDGSDGDKGAMRELLTMALLIALAASHGYIVLRVVVRHVVERAVWTECVEAKEREKEERDVKEKFLKGLLGDGDRGAEREDGVATRNEDGGKLVGAGGVEFWDNDEGLEEIRRISKEG